MLLAEDHVDRQPARQGAREQSRDDVIRAGDMPP